MPPANVPATRGSAVRRSTTRQPAIDEAQRLPAAAWAWAFAALAAALYVSALLNPFVYDDVRTVVENPSLRDLSNWRYLLDFNRFRPVVNLSYALDVALWGFEPLGFHLTNLLLHALDAALFFLLVRGLVSDRGDPAAADGGSPRMVESPRLVALFAAALFAAHPLMTEAVGYVSARPELLAAAFALASLLCARRALRGGGTGWWIAASFGWVLAAASRETGALVPVIVLAYDRLLRPGDDAARSRRLWRLHGPLLLVLAAGAALRLRTFLGAESPVLPRTMAENLQTELVILWRYVRLLLWPAGQSLVHPAQRIASPLAPKVLLAAAGLLAVAVLCWLLRRRYPLAVFGAIWFLVFIAPSSSFVPLAELMAEHRLYLASGGIFIIAAVALGHLAAWWRRAERRPANAPRTLAIAVVVVLALLTVERNRIWIDAATLWRDAAQKAPLTWAPHYGLAQVLRQRGDWGGAIAAYRRAVALRPDDNRARIDLAICLGQVGRWEEAHQALREALAVDPNSAEAFNTLGWLAGRTRQPDEARQRFAQALALDPRNVTARMNLAMLDEAVFRDYAEALRLCREVQQLQPGIPAAADCVRRNEARATR